MTDEKAYADFTITRVLIISFCGFIHTNVHDEEITLKKIKYHG